MSNKLDITNIIKMKKAILIDGPLAGMLVDYSTPLEDMILISVKEVKIKNPEIYHPEDCFLYKLWDNWPVRYRFAGMEL